MTDERSYAEVVEELRLHGPISGLWAKAYSEANGNKPQAEALYLRYRAEQLARAERELVSKPNQSSYEVESLYAAVSENFAKHAPFLLIGILVIIVLVAAAFSK